MYIRQKVNNNNKSKDALWKNNSENVSFFRNLKWASLLIYKVHTIFIIKLLSSETREAVKQNKGNYFSGKKQKQNNPTCMLQWKRYPFITTRTTILIWSARGEVRTRMRSLCNRDECFYLQNILFSHTEAHIPVYVHVYLYIEHINNSEGEIHMK